MKHVPRKFRQVQPDAGPDEAREQALSAYFDQPALVLLGDPGAGKTTAFREAARVEPSAAYVTVRDFLALPSDRRTGVTPYLDGLDEERAKTADGRTTLDELRMRLDELGRPRFRLSCRAADWYGSSDVQSLRAVAPAGDITVLDIVPLDEHDIRSMVAAPRIWSGCRLLPFAPRSRSGLPMAPWSRTAG
jgi:hypothetical protein